MLRVIFYISFSLIYIYYRNTTGAAAEETGEATAEGKVSGGVMKYKRIKIEKLKNPSLLLYRQNRKLKNFLSLSLSKKKMAVRQEDK